MKMDDIIVFSSLNDKLPREFEIVDDIFSHATSPTSMKMKSVVNEYGKQLVNLWIKSFGANHVLTMNPVKKKLYVLVKEFWNDVYNKGHRKSNKNPTDKRAPETLRQATSKWQKNHDVLFDVGKNIHLFDAESDEFKFYQQQKMSSRLGKVSNEVDEEYVMMQMEEAQAIAEGSEIVMEIEDESDDDTMSVSMNSSINLNVSTNRSGAVRLTTVGIDAGVQTEFSIPRPNIRKGRRGECSEKVKAACAMVSSICGISPELSRKVVKIVCKELFDMNFYLTPEEQAQGEENEIADKEDPVIDMVVGEEEVEEREKDGGKETEQEKIPTKRKDYTYVLPSARTIADHKQILASETEAEAAVLLLNKDGRKKAIIHFDTTSRNNIDGEWPSIILRFNEREECCEEVRLRPLFFAYEDRDQITSLFVESFNRLAAAGSLRQGTRCEPDQLWKQVDCLMTDAVTKNLEIEKTIAAALRLSHIPLHLLCKSHTVEALDRSNLEVLARIEKDVNQQQILESINPRLRSFFRGKTAVVECGIDALLKLVTHNKSANSCSEADQFDRICEREHVRKRIFLYQQRRFAKLGKSASSILDAKDILQMLLDEVDSTNQLTETCKIYLSSELFLTELECLSFFNYFVTFPFLNCVEVSSQSELLQIIPKLHNDLLQKKTDTLKKFVVQPRGIPVPQLSSDVSEEIVAKMCTSAADTIKRQCGREYGFADGEPQRATDLSKLSVVQLEGLPTNNCVNERDLSKFDKEAPVSKCRNRKFKAKNIRNNMVLYKSHHSKRVDRISKQISRALTEREKSWDSVQKKKHDERLKEKILKADKSKDYIKKLLQDCKSWGGPATTSEELISIISGRENTHHILRTEVAYYAHTHKSSRITNKDLYRINGVSDEEMIENLAILLDDDKQCSSATVANLPTNSDVLKCISHSTDEQEAVSVPSASVALVNQMCVVVWQNDDEVYEWYLGYVKNCVGEKYSVDHLARKLKDSDSKWKYPSQEDIQLTDPVQIVDIEVVGEWDLSADSRKRLFTLSNIKTVLCAVRKHVSE